MKRNTERGQSLVELGVSLLILLFLLSGAAEFGIVFFQYVQLRDAAQEGALYGSMNPAAWSDIETRARAASGSPLDLTNAGTDPGQVSVSIFIRDKNAPSTDLGTKVWENGAIQSSTSLACEGNGVRVVVAYSHRIFMPFMPRILNDDFIELNAEVTDTILQPFTCATVP